MNIKHYGKSTTAELEIMYNVVVLTVFNFRIIKEITALRDRMFFSKKGIVRQKNQHYFVKH